MENNIIEHANGTIIMNGGNSLSGCPNDWEEAKSIEQKLNNEKAKEDIKGPVWSFDCGYKLDYDGPIVSVSSRFYPPKTHYGSTWDGKVAIKMMGEEIAKEGFDCQTLEELKAKVDEYINSFLIKIKKALS